MLKLSAYNYIAPMDDDYFILYNSLSKVICKVANRFFPLFSNFQAALQKYEKELPLFQKHGFIVSDSYPEKDIMDLSYLNDVMDSRLDLTIMPTEQCNFRCKYCYETFSKGTMSTSLQESLIRYLSKNLRKFTGLSINWFGGEPLLALNEILFISEKAINLCKKLRIPYYAGITTNGYLLTLENFEKLLDARVTHFQITLDGTKQYHDQFKRTITDEPTFDTVWDNLRMIKAFAQNKNFDITIRTNVSVDLLDKLTTVVELYEKEFGDDSRFNFYFRPVGDWGGSSVKKICKSVFDKEQYSLVYRHLASIPNRLNYKMYYLELTQNIDICYAARKNSFVIGSDGTVYKCTTIFNDPLNHVGVLTEEGTLSLDAEKMAKWTMFSVPAASANPCSECPIIGICHNAACIADQVRGKSEYNCPHVKKSLTDILLLVSNNNQYCQIID